MYGMRSLKSDFDLTGGAAGQVQALVPQPGPQFRGVTQMALS